MSVFCTADAFYFFLVGITFNELQVKTANKDKLEKRFDFLK